MIRVFKVAQNAAVAGRWKCRESRFSHDHSGDIASLQSHFFQALAHVGLSPLPAPEAYRGSVLELNNNIEQMASEFVRLYQPWNSGFSWDRDLLCFFSRAEWKGRKIMREYDVLQLSDSQKAHLRRQRRKSGINPHRKQD